MPNLGLLSPVLSPLVYPNLAPPNWHNATPHGTIVLDNFAFSTDRPGLAFACGSLFTLAWPEPWNFGRTRYWRSTDGGTHWQTVQPPFSNQQYCDLAIPPGGNGIVLAAVSSEFESAPAMLWVSHDAGVSWRLVMTAPAGDAAMSLEDGLHDVVYRNGLMYGDMDFGSAPGGDTFAVSANDGATWTLRETILDQLEQQGGRIETIVPDYRSTGWWYRNVSLDGAAPMLEHSVDDGRTWSIIGPIGKSPLYGLRLATTPTSPEHLCAGQVSVDTNQVTLLASADGGRTWRVGTMPPLLQNVEGETSLNVSIGATGACYEGFHYGVGQEPNAGNSRYGFVQLVSDSTLLRYLPLTNNGNSLSLVSTFVPAKNDMSSRLVAEVEGTYPGWAPALAGLAAETTDGQIVWRSEP
jgi:hypothetical protein